MSILHLDFTLVTKRHEQHLRNREQRRRDNYAYLKSVEHVRRDIAAQHEADGLTYITNLSADEIKQITGKYPSWY